MLERTQFHAILSKKITKITIIKTLIFDLSFERLFLFVNDLKIDGFYRSLTNSSVNF